MFPLPPPTQLNIADNSIGEEGAAILARCWRWCGVRKLLQAVVPGFPATDLFERPEEGDAEVVRKFMYKSLEDPLPGRLRTVVLAGGGTGMAAQHDDGGGGRDAVPCVVSCPRFSGFWDYPVCTCKQPMIECRVSKCACQGSSALTVTMRS